MNLSDFGLVPHHCSTVKPGDKFGRLLVIATGKPPGNYRYQAVCQCDCGSEPKAIRIDGLRNGLVIGCGCIRLERTTTHGLTSHPLFQVHRHMMLRCYNPTSIAFHRYGGRGITVCDRWHDVRNFVTDLEPIYAKGLEMDRIDNDGNYELSNVRFVTPADNCSNRSSSHLVTYQGKTQSMMQWSKELNIPYSLIRDRICERGWSVEKTFSTPPLDAKERMALARSIRWAKPL